MELAAAGQQEFREDRHVAVLGLHVGHGGAPPCGGDAEDVIGTEERAPYVQCSVKIESTRDLTLIRGGIGLPPARGQRGPFCPLFHFMCDYPEL